MLPTVNKLDRESSADSSADAPPLPMNTITKKLQRADWLAALLGCVLLVVIGVAAYGPGGDDDTHITYTAAMNLADYGQVLNNSGDQVEQGSSILHVAALAAVMKCLSLLGIQSSIAAIGPIFSLVMAMLCMPLTLYLSKTVGINRSYTVVILLSLSVAFCYWAMGGLESSLAALSILGLVAVSAKYLNESKVTLPTRITLVLALLAFLMVRPEAYFIVIAATVTAFVVFFMQRESDKYRPLLQVFLLATLLFFVLLLWRITVFDQAFPQPVFAKADGLSVRKLQFGFLYFVYAMQVTVIVYALAVVGLAIQVFRRHSRFCELFVMLFSFSSAYLAFIVFSGGDWMTGGRFFAPIMPLLIICFLYGLKDRRWSKPLTVLVIMLAIIESTWFAFKMSVGMGLLSLTLSGGLTKTYNVDTTGYAWAETQNLVHFRDIPSVNALNAVIDAYYAALAGEGLSNKEYSPVVTIASIQMGMVPFHLRARFGNSVRFIDMRGLTSREITNCSFFNDSKRNWLGVKASYDKFFRAITEQQCADLDKPDIIYDLLNRYPKDNARRLQRIEDAGYHIVYMQSGVISAEERRKWLGVGAFVAVSGAIYENLPDNLKYQEVVF